MPTLAERNAAEQPAGKRPRWADLADSSVEIDSLPAAAFSLSQKSYDLPVSQDEGLDSFNSTLTLSDQADQMMGAAQVAAATAEPTVGEPQASSGAAAAAAEGEASIEGMSIILEESPSSAKSAMASPLSALASVAAKQRTPKKRRNGRKRSLESQESASVADNEEDAAADDDEASKEMPEELTDEQWEKRERKRREIINATKALPCYIAHAAQRAKGFKSEGTAVPRTPDATNRKISKRSWERQVMKWRIALKAQKEG